MPASVVRTPADEKRWARIKASVEKAHPGLKAHDQSRFYRIVMGGMMKGKERR